MNSLAPLAGLLGLMLATASLTVWALRGRLGTKLAVLAGANAAFGCLLVALVSLALSSSAPKAARTAPPVPSEPAAPAPATPEPQTTAVPTPEPAAKAAPVPEPASVNNTQPAEPAPPKVQDRRWHVVASMLNLRRGPGRDFPATAKLVRFDTVRVSGRAENGWVPVIADVGVGYVAGQFLRKGPGDEAFINLCRLSERTRPANGAILQRRHSGPHQLSIVNDGTQDAVLRLRNDVDALVLSVFVRAGLTANVTNIASGDYVVKVARGADFSPSCNVFTEDLVIRRAPGRISFRSSRAASSTVDVTNGSTYDIHIGSFFASSEAQAVPPSKF